MLRKIYLLTAALFLLLSQSISASHFMGYEMELINIKDANNNTTDTYKWRLRFYRDVTGIPIPSNFTFNVYRTSDNANIGNFTVSKINPQTFISYAANICAPVSAQNRVELGIYESPALNYAALNNSTGYYATSNHCCRNTGIVNVQGESSSYSSLMYIKFPQLSIGSATRRNSSPQFKELPLYGFSVGKQYETDWGATDPDGDSLVYTLIKALEGGPTAPSFVEIPFPNGYSLNGNIADGNPDFQVNSSTGIITFKPTIANNYLVAMKVEEYRSIAGQPTKIGEVRREMQIQTYLSTDMPPKLYDNASNTTKVDTIMANSLQTKIINLRSNDTPNDSLFIRIIAEPGATSNNILDTNYIDAAWSDTLGNITKGANAEQFIVRGKGSLLARLTIQADSNSASVVPYKFKIISYDKTCFVPLADTLNYVLYVLGNPCYSSVSSSVTACDSFVSVNGIKYYQSTTAIDTINTVVGCNLVTIQSITIIPSPVANFDNLNIYVTDTSKTYTYKVEPQSNATYQWLVSANGSIVSGANTNELVVKWNVHAAMQSITCFINRGNCFDSISSPIVVSHIVGVNNFDVNKINVYPNPVSNVLTFDIKNNLEHANISIYNTLGQLQQQSALHNNELNVAGLPEGVYQFVMSKGTQQFRGTFIKE